MHQVFLFVRIALQSLLGCEAYDAAPEWADKYMHRAGTLEIDVPYGLENHGQEQLFSSMDTQRLSEESRAALEHIRKDSPFAAILFHGSPLGEVPASPREGSSSMTSRWVLGTVASFLGLPVGYEETGSKDIFKQFYYRDNATKFPYTPGNARGLEKVTRAREKREHGWHVPNMAHPDMPQYTVVQCLRQDAGSIADRKAQVLLLPASCVAARLEDGSSGPRHMLSLDILQEERFSLKIDDNLNLDDVSVVPSPLRVLQHTGKEWRINIDQWGVVPLKEDDIDAQNALDDLFDVAEECFVSVKLEDGDILVFDNTEFAQTHARIDEDSGWWVQSIHAYTGRISPFSLFPRKDISPPSYVRGNPNLIRTRGVFAEAVKAAKHREL